MQAFRSSLAIELLELALSGALFAPHLGGVRPSRGGLALGLGAEAVRVVAVVLADAVLIAECALGPARKLMTRHFDDDLDGVSTASPRL